MWIGFSYANNDRIKTSCARNEICCESMLNRTPTTQACNSVNELIKTLGHNNHSLFFRHISDLVLIHKEPCLHTDTHNMTVS